MEFIIDTLKGLIRFALYLAVILVLEQYAACKTQIPYLDTTIVPGFICEARGAPLVQEIAVSINKMHTSTNFVTVENLVFVLSNDERKNWVELEKNDKTWWDSLKSMQNADDAFKSLLSGREITLRVSGKVYGKVNLEGIDTTNITKEKSGDKIIYTVHAPVSELLTVDIAPERIEVLGDDKKVLVGLTMALFKENEAFKTNTIKLSKQKILDKVCNEDFMKATADNAKSTLETLLSGIVGENIVVVDVSAGPCVLP